jgi:hypothetical protein
MATLDKIRLSGTTYDIIDSTAIHSLDGYWTTAETQNAITAATDALAQAIAEQGYQTSGDVQTLISQGISGKVDTSVYTAYTAATDTALGNKFQGAAYDSTTQRINFYGESATTGTPLTYIDASDFVKDGFLQSVTIENKTISGESVPCLVFVWNTDAGIQETDIPLSGIFDPTNYVDMATYTAYTASTDTTLGGKVDNTTYTAYTAATDTALSGKQETLVSGTNIKTVNNNSLLGSGNIDIQGGLQASVDGTTLIFS